MTNKYCNLDGSKKIREEYAKINDGFSKVEADIKNLSYMVTDHDPLVTSALVDIESEDFGQSPGNETYLNGRLSKWEQRVLDIEALINKLPVVEQSNILTVAKTGGMFETINDAIDYAKTYCSPSNRVAILIGPGIYNEKITLLPNPGIDLIGSGMDFTNITTDAAYPESALYTTGSGIYKDITFSSTGTNAYAMHWEAQVDPTEGKAIFTNCRFTALNHAGAGIGMGNSQTIVFYNCEFETYNVAAPAFYAHNHPAQGNFNQFLYVYNCIITNQAGGLPVQIDNAYAIAGNIDSDNQMYISFAGTVARLPRVSYKRGASEFLNYVPSHGLDSDNIVLLDSSEGTNILGLDYYKNRPIMGGYFFCASNGIATIPYPEAYRYTWTLEEAFDVNGNDIISTCTIVVSDKNFISVTTSNNNVKNNVMNLTVKGTPRY